MIQEWKRQEIILLYHAVCNNPTEKFHSENDTYPATITELAGLLQKPSAIIYEKIQHLLYLNSQGRYGKWSGGIKVDREVFEEFNEDRERLSFVATKIREEMLNNSVYYEDIFVSFDEAEAKEIERLKREGWTVAAEIGSVSPSIRYCTIKRHDRTPTVSAIAKLRAGFKCEVQECDYKPFIGIYNLPYVEVHHITRLAEGGEDTLKNTACLCPIHHREIHFGKTKEKLQDMLLKKRKI
ncbi:MAG: HNH endonuclease, partial [Planctomycetes bacterium]|nr:HNH endonuclease [Planctomycetota bacterium]